MSLSNTSKVLIVVAVVGVSFALGRYTVPEKVKVETKIVEVEKKTSSSKEDTSVDKHKNTKIIVVEKPNGEKTTTTEISENTDIDKKKTGESTSDSTKNTDSLKETTRGDSKLTISALGGVDFTKSVPQVVYGASVFKPILGPITIGVWGLSSPSCGASVGIQF